jgi:plasmid maintenance system killer protein
MDLLKTYADSNVTNLDDLDDIIEDYPEIKNIAVEFNSDFAKISTLIDKSSNYSSEDKKIIKKVFLIFTNILIELNGHKYINNDLLEEIQKLIEIGIQKDKIIEKLKIHAVKTEEGKKLVSESQKELKKKIEMIVKTKNDKKLSSYRENTLKSSLIKTRDLKKKIYSHDELKKINELKNKQLNDVEAIAVTEIPKK